VSRDPSAVGFIGILRLDLTGQPRSSPQVVLLGNPWVFSGRSLDKNFAVNVTISGNGPDRPGGPLKTGGMQDKVVREYS